MNDGSSVDQSAAEGMRAPSSAVVLPASTQHIAVQVDFAHVVRGHLVLYGWILGLSKWVAAAELRHGESTHDLLSNSVRISRPDVTRHFGSISATDEDEHGFFFMVPVSTDAGQRATLKLFVALSGGESAESVWHVRRGELAFATFFRQNQATFDWLVSHIKPADAKSFLDLASSVVPAAPLDPATIDSPRPSFDFEVDLCCILENRLLFIFGWLMDPDRTLLGAGIRIGTLKQDFLTGMEFTSRPDIDARTRLEPDAAPQQFGFTYLSAVPDFNFDEDELEFNFTSNTAQTRTLRQLVFAPQRARKELGNLLTRLDADCAITLIDRILPLLNDSPAERVLLEFLRSHAGRAVDRLPVSLECRKPCWLLHLDRVVAIAENGIFLNGWFNAETEAASSVACHNGVASVAIDEKWIRHARADVSAHLAKTGIATTQQHHGFACYVPLKPSVSSPYFISVTSRNGIVRRLRVAAPAADSAMQSVRAVLTSFTVEHRALRELLDRHVGPAVQTAWAARPRQKHGLAVHRFGAQPSDPQISMIVPLYGRFDLAECQLALFANDPDFAHIELIYFVDDPAIYDEFRSQCADLFAMYQVAFTVAYCGFNLGFAGANNCAAALARGRHLLLLNSDVFPKQSGWASEMLRIYTALQEPGVLGVKLLFEDGSVQHAGMSFRRHATWSGLWINHHSYKGQSAGGLDGVREVDAVTAACVLVDAKLYAELGGLSEEYIVGDFEDSDFCLRVAAAGRRNRVALDIELYHLERQSQDRIGDSHWRTNLTLYNCWQHHERWGAQIGRALG